MTAVARDTARAIRPFHVDVPDEALAEMRRRIAATVWPERETVPDSSQGVPLATMQEIARYWATRYDWRPCEAKLNAVPQFIKRSTGWTSTSSTFVRNTRMRCRSSSTTDGLARSSSSSRSSIRS
jgi:hypothetical protein